MYILVAEGRADAGIMVVAGLAYVRHSHRNLDLSQHFELAGHHNPPRDNTKIYLGLVYVLTYKYKSLEPLSTQHHVNWFLRF